MKTKLAFLVGVGVGYLIGTDSGRENLEKAKTWAKDSWENPEVQSKVKDVEERVTKVVREQGGQLSEKVSTAVKDATGRATGRSSSTPDPTAAI